MLVYGGRETHRETCKRDPACPQGHGEVVSRRPQWRRFTLERREMECCKGVRRRQRCFCFEFTAETPDANAGGVLCDCLSKAIGKPGKRERRQRPYRRLMGLYTWYICISHGKCEAELGVATHTAGLGRDVHCPPSAPSEFTWESPEVTEGAGERVSKWEDLLGER